MIGTSKRKFQAALRLTAVGAVFALAVAAAAPSAAEDMPVPFTLTKPVGNGPFPAIVILHDCSGLGPHSSGSPARWAGQLTQDGYVTIWPDSFSTRGFPRGVCTEAAQRNVPYRDRAADAYAALKYVRSLPYVDPRRVAVMGGSHGGASTLATIVDVPANAAHRPGFAAAISLYPNCAFGYGAWSVKRDRTPGSPITGYSGVFKPLAPLLILTGARDDWTPAAPCRKLTEAAATAGYPVEIKVYDGAHHAFDSNAPIRFVAERRNFNVEGGRGATTGGNRAAWDDAIVRVRAFLKSRLAAP